MFVLLLQEIATSSFLRGYKTVCESLNWIALSLNNLASRCLKYKMLLDERRGIFGARAKKVIPVKNPTASRWETAVGVCIALRDPSVSKVLQCATEAWREVLLQHITLFTFSPFPQMKKTKDRKLIPEHEKHSSRHRLFEQGFFLAGYMLFNVASHDKKLITFFLLFVANGFVSQCRVMPKIYDRSFKIENVVVKSEVF